MDKFNIDWFMKGNPNMETKYETLDNGDEVAYCTTNDKFQKLVVSKNSNYQYLTLYERNGVLYFKSILLFSNNIHMGYYYDKAGNVTQEIDFEKDYPFSVDEVIELIKKDYQIDISTSKKVLVFTRWNNDSQLKFPIYLIAFYDNNDRSLNLSILLDGRNGTYLNQRTSPNIREDAPNAYELYIELVKQGKVDPSSQSTNKNESTNKKPWSIFD